MLECRREQMILGLLPITFPLVAVLACPVSAHTWALLIDVDDHQNPRTTHLKYTVEDVTKLYASKTFISIWPWVPWNLGTQSEAKSGSPTLNHGMSEDMEIRKGMDEVLVY